MDNKFAISYLKLTSYGSTIGCRIHKVPANLKLKCIVTIPFR